MDDGAGNYPGECVSLIKLFIKENGWPYKHGNAIDWQKNGDDFYQWIPNTPDGVPAQGDFLVLNIGKYGHIGIVESADVNSILLLNQNYPHGNDTDPVQVTKFTYTKVVGWLHPKVDTTTPPAQNNNMKLEDKVEMAWGKVSVKSPKAIAGDVFVKLDDIIDELNRNQATIEGFDGKLKGLQTQLDEETLLKENCERDAVLKNEQIVELNKSLNACINKPEPTVPVVTPSPETPTNWFTNLLNIIFGRR